MVHVFCRCRCRLFIIGGVAALAKQSLGQAAWVVVALLAVGNAGGRVIAGILSDKIGRAQTLAMMMTCQALLIFSLIFISKNSAFLVVTAATLIGFNYGTNLSLSVSDQRSFRLKNFASITVSSSQHGASGGFIFPRVAQMVVARTDSLVTAYIVTAVLLLVSASMALYGFIPRQKPKRPRSLWRLRPFETNVSNLQGNRQHINNRERTKKMNEFKFHASDEHRKNAWVKSYEEYKFLYDLSIKYPKNFGPKWQTSSTGRKNGTTSGKYNYSLSEGPIQIEWFSGAKTISPITAWIGI